MTDVEICCEVKRDDPARPSIAIFDGTMLPDPGQLTGERETWVFIPRREIRACEPPLDALPATGPRLVLLTIPEWLAKDRGLI